MPSISSNRRPLFTIETTAIESRLSSAESVGRWSLHGLLCVLLAIHHLVVRLMVGLVDRVAAPQRSSLFPKLIVLLDLSTAWQAPRCQTIKATAAADTKLLAYTVSLHPKRKTRNQECDCKTHDHARSIAAAVVRVLWAVWEMCKAMLGFAKHAWSAP